jgi:hypothetical protein
LNTPKYIYAYGATSVSEAPKKTIVVLNWLEELQQKGPEKWLGTG